MAISREALGPKENLYVRELIERVYTNLKNRYGQKEINLPEGVPSMIFCDEDWHRTDRGYMIYESVTLLRVDGKSWALGLGKPDGRNFTSGYTNDLWCAEVLAEGKTPEQLVEELAKLIKQSEFFNNSLVVGQRDGSLMIGKKSPLGEELRRLLEPKISEFIDRQPKRDSRGYLHLDLTPVLESPLLFKSELADFLTESISQILSRA